MRQGKLVGGCSKRVCFSDARTATIHVNSQWFYSIHQTWASKFKPNKNLIIGGGIWHEVPLLTEELWVTDNCWERES